MPNVLDGYVTGHYFGRYIFQFLFNNNINYVYISTKRNLLIEPNTKIGG